MRLDCIKIKRAALFPLVTVIIGTCAYALFFALPVRAEQSTVSIKYPPDKTVMEFDILDISVKVDRNDADLVKVAVDGRTRESVVPDQDYECFSLHLQPGTSRIEVTAFKDGKETGRAVLSAFHRSDLSRMYNKVPDGFKRVSFHSRDNTECSSCHILEPTEYDEKPISPVSFAVTNFDKETVFASTSTCYSCHKEITARPYVHGPAAVWSCLSCHEKGSDPVYSVKKPDNEMCFKCHVEQRDEWSSKKFVHGPVNIGKCTICHSPHSANNSFNLYKPTWNLCTNCHFEKGSGMHVLGDSFSTEGHPTRNRPDPLRKGKELSCASCHEPHASNFPNLWQFNVQGLFELCRKCHFDK